MTDQLNEYDMRLMTPEQIGEAYKAGRFRDLLDPDIAPTLPLEPMGTYPKDDTVTDQPQLTQADLANLTPAEIVKAQADGRLSNVLAGVEEPPAPPYDPLSAEPLTAAQVDALSLDQRIEAARAGRLPTQQPVTVPFVDVDQGTRGVAINNGQLTQEDLRRMTPAQIVKAQAEGRCDDLLRVRRG